MIGRMQRWWVPALAAVAVLAVIAVGVAAMRSPGANDEAGFSGGGDDGAGAPPYSGTEPGSPDEPVEVPGGGVDGEIPPDDGAAEPRQPGDPSLIALDGYYPYDARRLALNFYNGVPECYGRAGVPQVEEHADRVVVAVPRTPATAPKGTACIEIAVAGSVEVTLEAPLDGRAVVDAATGRRLEAAASPYEGDQAS